MRSMKSPLGRTVTVSIAALASLLMTLAPPAMVEAASRHGGGGHHGGGHHGGFHGHHGRGCCFGGFFGFPFYYPYLGYPYAYAYPYPYAYSYPYPAYTYPPPTYSSAGPMYDAQPVTAQPSVQVSPNVQREVVYPNGKYVLYGDGVTQPWQWVWVPR